MKICLDRKARFQILMLSKTLYNCNVSKRKAYFFNLSIMIPYSNLFFSNPLGFVALNKSMSFDKILFQIKMQFPFGNNHIQCLDPVPYKDLIHWLFINYGSRCNNVLILLLENRGYALLFHRISYNLSISIDL